jgi:hypothetical protein
MWVPGNAVLWVGITIIFFRWALSQEKKDRIGARGAESKDKELVLSS